MLIQATEGTILHHATHHRMSNIIAELWPVVPLIEVKVNVLWTQFGSESHHTDKKAVQSQIFGDSTKKPELHS